MTIVNKDVTGSPQGWFRWQLSTKMLQVVHSVIQMTTVNKDVTGSPQGWFRWQLSTKMLQVVHSVIQMTTVNKDVTGSPQGWFRWQLSTKMLQVVNKVSCTVVYALVYKPAPANKTMYSVQWLHGQHNDTTMKGLFMFHNYDVDVLCQHQLWNVGVLANAYYTNVQPLLYSNQ